MKKILEGQSRRFGSVLSEIDTNFIEVCNSILRIAFPECNLKGYAAEEPGLPELNDCYLVKEDATIWDIEVEKNQILVHDGGESWDLLPFKITEINQAIQFLYFDADKIAINPIEGLDATNVQTALQQITAALISAEITIPSSGSGSI